MPGPLPGMDPWLEHPAVFPNLHQRLITYACDALQAEVSERYFVSIGERVYIDLREVLLEIQDATSGGAVVTVIEVLSPSNKERGRGRELYREKQENVLASSASWWRSTSSAAARPRWPSRHASTNPRRTAWW